MPNRLDLPPELEQLIEKRQNGQRRQEAEEVPPEDERRTGVDRREKSDENPPGNIDDRDQD